jgi:methylmalonyl-CoA mutase N-terminal domain/subunit
MLRFHTQVAGVSLTAQQPLNNIARVTLQALASVLGGTQSLHTNSYDEALGLPTETSATVALRTQQIIAEESGVADTVDPMAGSWHVERLTKEIYERSRSIIDQIEAKGGAINAIEEGWQQHEIHLSAYAHLNEIEKGERRIVGINHGVMEENDKIPILKTDASLGDAQTSRLKVLRDSRDKNRVLNALKSVQTAAHTDENLFPHVLEAVRARATLGEIVGELKSVFGTYTAPSGF